jgi:acetyltransferase-like isoleucine patch superfamily enzyme
MTGRKVERVETAEKNSLLCWPPTRRDFIRTTLNAIVVLSAYRIPVPPVKNFLYRLVGTEIGENTVFDAKTDIFFPEKVKVGDDCIIAGEARILSHEFLQGEYRKGEVVIEDGVIVGQDAIILPGVKIGENATVGAGSVVTKDVEANTVVAGNPAEKIRDKEFSG